MAHQSNSHNAPWLTSSQTEMFSVGALSVRSSCPVVDAGALKMTDMKLQDMKLTDRVAGHEIAGHENGGPNSRT